MTKTLRQVMWRKLRSTGRKSATNYLSGTTLILTNDSPAQGGAAVPLRSDHPHRHARWGGPGSRPVPGSRSGSLWHLGSSCPDSPRTCLSSPHCRTWRGPRPTTSTGAETPGAAAGGPPDGHGTGGRAPLTWLASMARRAGPRPRLSARERPPPSPAAPAQGLLPAARRDRSAPGAHTPRP